MPIWYPDLKLPLHPNQAQHRQWQQHDAPSHYVMFEWKCTKCSVKKNDEGKKEIKAFMVLIPSPHHLWIFSTSHSHTLNNIRKSRPSIAPLLSRITNKIHTIYVFGNEELLQSDLEEWHDIPQSGLRFSPPVGYIFPCIIVIFTCTLFTIDFISDGTTCHYAVWLIVHLEAVNFLNPLQRVQRPAPDVRRCNLVFWNRRTKQHISPPL